MGQQQLISVNVQGGSTEANNQVATIIHQSLMEKGFMNVSISSFDTYEEAQGISVHQAVMMAHPSLFATPISINAEVSYDSEISREAMAIAAARERPVNYINSPMQAH
jgi:hypothetical protein